MRLVLLTCGTGVGLCYYAYAEHGIHPLLLPGAAIRCSRDVFAVASITLDYLRTVRSKAYKELNPQKKEEMLAPVHKRAAVRLRDLFFKNAGIYIKIGQHLTQLQYVLPEAYVVEMMPMLDKAPTTQFKRVRKVVEEGMGRKLEDVFEEFDPVPIASASLAQVHRAVKKESKEVLAVKVQHEHLLETSVMDVMMIKVLIHGLYRFYPNLDYRWLVQEVEENLPKELNFLHEAKNLERCSKNVANIPHVKIPRVHHELSSKRVLTMDFENGIPLTNVEKLYSSGLDLSKIAKLISTVFCSQIFLHGFVHCDPHPGNILVRNAPNSKKGEPEIVLLDHGLYRELDDEFRLNYANLWKAIISADEKNIKTYSEKMNAGNMYHLFASMLTLKPWNKIISTPKPSVEISPKQLSEEMNEISAYAQEYLLEINHVLSKVPRPLLLLFKTNDCLRSIDSTLKAPINSFLLTSRYCTLAIQKDRLYRNPGIKTKLKNFIESVNMEYRIWMISMFKSIQGVLRSCLNWLLIQ